eukprot:gene20248-27000_t
MQFKSFHKWEVALRSEDQYGSREEVLQLMRSGRSSIRRCTGKMSALFTGNLTLNKYEALRKMFVHRMELYDVKKLLKNLHFANLCEQAIELELDQQSNWVCQLCLRRVSGVTYAIIHKVLALKVQVKS